MHKTSNATVALHMIAIISAALACHRTNPPSAMSSSMSSIRQSSATPGDSTPRCAGGLTIELASGQRIANSRVCISEHRDTSYVIAYSSDEREVFRMTGWRVDMGLVDSTVNVLAQRLDIERGTGKTCHKQGIERYWGSPPNVLVLRIDRPDLSGLPASVSLAQEADLPSC